MSIEQKAREIAIADAAEKAAEVIDDMRVSGDETDLRTVKYRVVEAIRALIEEQKV